MIAGSLRLWLVRTAIAIRSSGSQRTARANPRNRPECPSATCPPTVHPLDAEAVRDRRMLRGRREDVVEHRLPRGRRQRRDAASPYMARAQTRDRSAVVAIRPAPPAAVTTEVNGTTRVPSDRSIGLRVAGCEPVAVGDGTVRHPVALVYVWDRPERPEEAVRSCVWSERSADLLGEHAEDQVVRVRVVPAVARRERTACPT